MRFVALNENPTDDPESERAPVCITKEAQESEALSCYNDALVLQRSGLNDQAENAFKDLLQHPYLQEVFQLRQEGNLVTHPGRKLLYSINKILGLISLGKKDDKSALTYLIKAVEIDSTEVTVWYKIGCLAQDACNLVLARLAFSQGLQLNDRHWPCLDKLIAVFYVLGDYYNCLLSISKALKFNPKYEQGHIFIRQIYKEDPYLKRITSEMFHEFETHCSTLKFSSEVSEKYIGRAMDMRQRRRHLMDRDTKRTTNRLFHGSKCTWQSLGGSILSCYEDLAAKEQSLGSLVEVDIPNFIMSNNDTKIISDEKKDEYTVSCVNQPEDDTDVAMETTELQQPMSQESLNTPSEILTQSSVSQDEKLEDNSMILDEISRLTTTNKRGTKRKRPVILEESLEKRRSERVRNTSLKKMDEIINYSEIFQRILPPGLQAHDLDTGMSDVQHFHQVDSSSSYHSSVKATLLEEGEAGEVHKFLSNEAQHCNIISLLNNFLFSLSQLDDKKWNDNVKDIYIKMYHKLRTHLIFPSCFSPERMENQIFRTAKIALVNAELVIGCLSSAHDITDDSIPDMESEEFCADLCYLTNVCNMPDVMGKYLDVFRLRVLWLKSHVFIKRNLPERAEKCLEALLLYLKEYREDGHERCIILTNCKNDFRIDEATVQRVFDSLNKNRTMDAVMVDFEREKHSCVIENLTKLLKPLADTREQSSSHRTWPELPDQMVILMKALTAESRLRECLQWAEVFVNEAVSCHRHAPTAGIREKWAATLIEIFSFIHRLVTQEADLWQSLGQRPLSRLSNNLIAIIEVNLDTSDNVTEMPVASLLPWILLHAIILNEEKSQKDSGIVTHEMSSSIRLLLLSHDHLGRRHWCTNGDGVLLTYTMQVIRLNLLHIKQLMAQERTNREKFRSLKEELSQAYEQCTHCLYGYPSRRTRASYISDHSSPQIKLLWKRSLDVFRHYKPKVLPEFDSYKSSTVSSELESLLTRICDLVPTCYLPDSESLQMLKDYIYGHVETIPEFTPKKISNITRVIYYLLADYYLKNTEQSNAIEFYHKDLCLNSNRFDSWAGLALSYMSDLEQNVLNSNELNIWDNVEKKSRPALRCLKRAVELNNGSSNLWMEYGTLTYQLHSFYSHQIKMCEWLQNTGLDGSVAEKRKSEMLQQSRFCINQAEQCENYGHSDEWLQRYIMGKICEKNLDMKEALKHYRQAADCIDRDHRRAHYPKKITFVYSQPYLAVESLEMYYRLHTSILKLLLKEDVLTYGDLEMADSYINDAKKWLFVTEPDKRKMENAMENTENLSLSSPTSDSKCFTKSHRAFTNSDRHLVPTDTSTSHDKSQMFVGSNIYVPDVPIITTEIAQLPNLIDPEAVVESEDEVIPVRESKSTNSECLLRIDNKPADKSYVPSYSNDVDEELGIKVAFKYDNCDSSSSRADEVAEDIRGSAVSSRGPVTQTFPGDSKSCGLNIDDEDIPSTVDCVLDTTLRRIEADLLQNYPTRISDSSGYRMETTWVKDSHSNDTENELNSRIKIARSNSNEIISFQDSQIENVFISDNIDGEEFTMRETISSPRVHEVKSRSCIIISDSSNDLSANVVLEKSGEVEDVVNDICINLCDTIDEVEEILDNTIAMTHSAVSMTDNTGAMTDDTIAMTHSAVSMTDNTGAMTDDTIAMTHSAVSMTDNTGAMTDDTITKTESPISTNDNTIAMSNEGIDKNHCDLAETSSDINAEGHLTKDIIMISDSSNEESVCNVSKSSLDATPDEIVSFTSVMCSDAKHTADVPHMEYQSVMCSDAKHTADVPHMKYQSLMCSDAKHTDDVPHMEYQSLMCCDTKHIVYAPHVEYQSTFHEYRRTLIKSCEEALKFCLLRFPQHYKAQYHLAHLYFCHPYEKNTSHARDIFLIGQNWKEFPHMVCPGLFSERKNFNFFQGIWRIPSPEVDRNGSFATHMFRSIDLLERILLDIQDHKQLFELHKQLSRTPDSGKKYLRDSERIVLVDRAIEYVVEAAGNSVPHPSQPNRDPDSERRFLHDCYSYWIYCNSKYPGLVHRCETLLSEAYEIFSLNTVTQDISNTDYVMEFCQKRFSLCLKSQCLD